MKAWLSLDHAPLARVAVRPAAGRAHSSLVALSQTVVNRWILALALALTCGIALGTCAPVSAATVPAYTIHNATDHVVYVEIQQKTPFLRLTRLYVNPRRTESRYFTGPLGDFEVHASVYIGKATIKLAPRKMTVATGKEGHIIIDYLASGKNDENLDFSLKVVSAP